MNPAYPCIFVAFDQIGAQGRLANNINLAITIDAHVNDNKKISDDLIHSIMRYSVAVIIVLSLHSHIKKNKITRLQKFG